MQRHIATKNVDGTVTIDKKSIADICELTRRSPTASRVFFFLLAYAANNNTLISNIKTIGKALNLDRQRIWNAFKYLTENGFVEAYEVELNHDTGIVKYWHDKDKYEESNGTVWEVVSEQPLGFVIKGKHNKFVINDMIAKCSTNQSGNVLLHIGNNLFYDVSLPESELGFGC
jgi:DNA-binding Lrp family transcriptional regulator